MSQNQQPTRFLALPVVCTKRALMLLGAEVNRCTSMMVSSAHENSHSSCLCSRLAYLCRKPERRGSEVHKVVSE